MIFLNNCDNPPIGCADVGMPALMSRHAHGPGGQGSGESSK